MVHWPSVEMKTHLALGEGALPLADDGKRISACQCDDVYHRATAIRVEGLEEGSVKGQSRAGAGGSLQKHVYIYVNQAFSSIKNSFKKSLQTNVFLTFL